MTGFGNVTCDAVRAGQTVSLLTAPPFLHPIRMPEGQSRGARSVSHVGASSKRREGPC